MESKFVPTPWEVSNKVLRYGTPLIEIKSHHIENGISYSVTGPIAFVIGHHDEAEATAAHIVKCINAHDELVKALKLAYDFLSPISNNFEGRITTEGQYMLSKMRDALEKVTDTPIEKQPS